MFLKNAGVCLQYSRYHDPKYDSFNIRRGENVFPRFSNTLGLKELQLYNYIELSLFWEAASRSATQEFHSYVTLRFTAVLTKALHWFLS
jgi:hypothetical protein